MALVFTLGFDQSFVRFYFDPPKGLSSRSLMSLAILAGSTVCLVMFCFVMAFGAAPISKYLFGEVNFFALGMLGLFVEGSIIVRLLYNDARMRGNYRSYNAQYIPQYLISHVSFVIVALFSTHYTYSITVMAVGMLVLAIIVLIKHYDVVGFKGSSVNSSNLRIIAAFGLPSMLVVLSSTLSNSIGKLILGGFGYFDAVGVLAIATTLANALIILQQAFSLYWAPFMYKNYMTEQSAIYRVHECVMIACVASVVAIILIQDALFSFIGLEYRSAQAFFMLIMLNPLQTLVCETTAYGITLENKPMYSAYIIIIGIFINLTITIILAPVFGAAAAALGVACSAVIIGILRSVIGQRLYKSIRSPRSTLLTSGILIALCIANIEASSNIPFRIAICLASMCYCCFAYRDALRWGLRKLKKRYFK